MKETESNVRATLPYHPRIAVVFDFDRTLASDTVHFVLNHCGINDPARFERQYLKPLGPENWDALLAQLSALIRFSQDSNSCSITKQVLEEVGAKLTLFPGVDKVFDRIRRWTHAVSHDIEVEFFVLTCGLVQVHRAHPIAREFKAMWGCEFYFDERGQIQFPKKVITFPEKIRYLLQLSKGIGAEGPNGPSDVFRDVPLDQLYVPLNQILYIGDGGSDMPAFSLMNEHGGIALGVVHADKISQWSGYSEVHSGRRVDNLCPADYSEGSELLNSIQLAVESIAKRIALRKLSRKE